MMQAAFYVTQTNDEDGIVYAIKKYLQYTHRGYIISVYKVAVLNIDLEFIFAIRRFRWNNIL